MKYCLFIVLLFLSACGAPKLDLEKSDHFDGKKFFNPYYPKITKSFFTLLKWKFSSDKTKWPERVEIQQRSVEKKRVKTGELRATFINHASVLIQMDSLNILTDPIYSKRTSPLSWVGPKRVKLPGVKFEDLPKIDLILVSHNHYDALDLPTLEMLHERDRPKIIFGLGNSYYLPEDLKSQAIELDWWDDVEINGVKVTFLPSQHWSKRHIDDVNKSLWGAFGIVGKHKVYFAGDSGYGQHFKDTFKKMGFFDLSLIPIGAYEPRWFMKPAHINPEEAYKVHLDLHSKFSIGIHHGTFQLTDEGIDEPRIRIEKLAKENNDYPFVVLENGESIVIK